MIIINNINIKKIRLEEVGMTFLVSNMFDVWLC